jgi:hypothetical protein
MGATFGTHIVLKETSRVGYVKTTDYMGDAHTLIGIVMVLAFLLPLSKSTRNRAVCQVLYEHQSVVGIALARPSSLSIGFAHHLDEDDGRAKAVPTFNWRDGELPS